MVKFGVIGAGRIGKVHTESICLHIKNAKIKTLADPFMTGGGADGEGLS